QQLGQSDPSGRVPSNSINVAAVAAILVTFASGAQISWLSRAYGIAVAVALLLKIGCILRLRRTRKEPQAFTTPFNLRLGSREIPVGLVLVALLVGVTGLALLFSADIPSIAAMSMIPALGLLLAAGRREPTTVADDEEPFDLLTAPDVSLG